MPTRLEEAINKLPKDLIPILEKLMVFAEDAPAFLGMREAVETSYFDKVYSCYKPLKREEVKTVVEDYLVSKINAKEESLTRASQKIESLTNAATTYLMLLNNHQPTLSFRDALRMEYNNLPIAAFNKMYTLMNNQDIEPYEEKLDFFLSLVDIYITR